jgi:hypothetical protein
MHSNDERVRAPFLTRRHLIAAPEMVLVLEQGGVQQAHVLATQRGAMESLNPTSWLGQARLARAEYAQGSSLPLLE